MRVRAEASAGSWEGSPALQSQSVSAHSTCTLSACSFSAHSKANCPLAILHHDQTRVLSRRPKSVKVGPGCAAVAPLHARCFQHIFLWGLSALVTSFQCFFRPHPIYITPLQLLVISPHHISKP